MFRQFTILLIAFAISSFAAPINFPTEEESEAELKSAGMTQGSIDGLNAFNKRFVNSKFIADYKTDVENFIRSMSPKDQTIYNNYLKKYGLA